MGTLLKGGTLVELEPALVEVSDLRVDGGVISARGPKLTPSPGEEVIDARGKVILPGLVNAHHHLYSALARGMPAPAQPTESFQEILEHIWWRLDQALDLDSIQLSSTVGALDALASGTTTVIDHHASPRAITGSLTKVARGLNDVGLRGVLAYEVTDRHGALAREEGIEETVAFVKKAKGRFRGLIGAHASFTLSDDALQGLKEAVEATQSGLHIHLAEDPSDERLSVQRYGETPVNRLMNLGLLTPKTLVAHAVHLSWPELSTVLSTGTWLLHNPRSNMNNQVGYAPAGKFGARATLGTDGLGADMFQEAKAANLRSRDAGQPIDVLRYLANGHRLASQIFDAKIGPLREGAQADLLLMDYRSPTPLTSENLAGHFLFGFESRQVESVMVEGAWRLWARRALSVNPDTVHEEARQAAAALWARMAKIQSAHIRTPRPATAQPVVPAPVSAAQPAVAAPAHAAPAVIAAPAPAAQSVVAAPAPAAQSVVAAPAPAAQSGVAAPAPAAQPVVAAPAPAARAGAAMSAPGPQPVGEASAPPAQSVVAASATPAQPMGSAAQSVVTASATAAQPVGSAAQSAIAAPMPAAQSGAPEGALAPAVPLSSPPPRDGRSERGAKSAAARSPSEPEPITSPQHSIAAPPEEDVPAELTQTLLEAPKADEGYDDHATLEPDSQPVIALEPEQVVPAATPTPKGKGKGRPSSTRQPPPVLVPVEGKPTEEGNAEGGSKKKSRAKA